METGYFSSQEMTLISDVTHIALGNAGKSLATMSKDEILVKNVELYQNPSQQIKLDNTVSEYHLLYTPIVGELCADTYLLFSPAAEKSICEILLPGSEIGQREMRDALLMEVDNIVTASIVTKFADILKRNTHGDVPSLKLTRPDAVEKAFQEKISSPDTHLFFQATLSFFYKHYSVLFYCFFDQTIKEAVHHFDFNKMKGQKSHHKTDIESKDTTGIQGFIKKFFV